MKALRGRGHSHRKWKHSGSGIATIAMIGNAALSSRVSVPGTAQARQQAITSQQSRKRGEFAVEVRSVPGKVCDELEVLELETGGYAAAHQGKVSQAPGSLPDPFPDHCHALAIISGMTEHALHQCACQRLVPEQLKRRSL